MPLGREKVAGRVGGSKGCIAASVTNICSYVMAGTRLELFLSCSSLGQPWSLSLAPQCPVLCPSYRIMSQLVDSNGLQLYL